LSESYLQWDVLWGYHRSVLYKQGEILSSDEE